MDVKTKKVIISSVVLFVFVICFSLFTLNSDIRKLERKLDIDFPKSAELIYSENEIGWFGEGGVISVVQLDNNSIDFIDDLFFSIDSGKPSEVFTKEEFETEVDHNIDVFLREVPNEYRPNWSNDYIWTFGGNDSSQYLIYDEDTNILFLIEVIW